MLPLMSLVHACVMCVLAGGDSTCAQNSDGQEKKSWSMGRAVVGFHFGQRVTSHTRAGRSDQTSAKPLSRHAKQ
jgi:hypothetical protein